MHQEMTYVVGHDICWEGADEGEGRCSTETSYDEEYRDIAPHGEDIPTPRYSTVRIFENATEVTIVNQVCTGVKLCMCICII